MNDDDARGAAEELRAECESRAVEGKPKEPDAQLGVRMLSDSGKPPTGRCRCPHRHWHRGDSPTSCVRVTCLRCGNHWWSEGGVETPGPNFTPYTEILAAAGLSTVAIKREARDRSRAKRVPYVPRFGWWLIADINPRAAADGLSAPGLIWRDATAEAIHDYLDEVYRRRHEAGDHDAVFEYVRVDQRAFESAWVGRQMTAWRAANTPAAHAKIKKLVTRMLDNRGRRRASTSWERIRRDLDVLAHLLANRRPKLEGAIESAASKFNMSRPNVLQVWTHYKPLHDAEVPSAFETDAGFIRFYRSLIPRSTKESLIK